MNVTRCYDITKNAATAAIGFSIRTVRAYISRSWHLSNIVWKGYRHSATFGLTAYFLPSSWNVKLQDHNCKYMYQTPGRWHLLFKVDIYFSKWQFFEWFY